MNGSRRTRVFLNSTFCGGGLVTACVRPCNQHALQRHRIDDRDVLRRNGSNVTVTADADPSNFVLGTVLNVPILAQAAVTTMTIAGFVPFQITLPNFGPLLVDTTSLFGPGTGYGGFGFQRGTSSLKGLAALGDIPSFPGSVTINGSLEGSAGEPFTTTAGDLFFSFDPGATEMFSGEFQFPSSAVPEPTSMAIYGLGVLGMALRARRKSKA